MKKIFISTATIVMLLGMTACNTEQEHTHTIVTHEAKEATCTEDGYKAYEECTECDYTTYVKINALGHDLEHYELAEATCTEDGTKEYWYCTECETKFSDEEGIYKITDEELNVLSTGHSLTHHELVEESCTAGGIKEHWNCDKCGTYFTDEEGTQPIDYEDLIISKKVHIDENKDYICDHGCGEVLLEKEKLQQIIENTMSSTQVTIKEAYIPGARDTTYYFDENLLYLNDDNNREKYYYTEEDTTYLFTNSNEWSKEITTEVVKYNISYLFENKFNLEISSELSVYNCDYGFFEEKTMFEYTNTLGTKVEMKLNDEGTLLDGIYICDENNNIIYMFKMIYGENNEIILSLETINNCLEGKHVWTNGVCEHCELVCAHTEFTFTDNGDGTHKKDCTCDHEENSVHTLVYTADDDANTITESCSDGCGYTSTITLKAPTGNLIYNGSKQEATVEGTIIADYEITYNSEPIYVGTYTATITIEEVSISLTYEIIQDPATGGFDGEWVTFG